MAKSGQVAARGSAYDVFARLVRVQTVLWNDVDGRVRERCGHPLTHVVPLGIVERTPECRVQDIVEELHITVGGASKVVDRLVAAGHVDRAAHPRDRRSSVLSLTAAGRALLDDVRPEMEEFLEARFSAPLGTSELAELDRLLQVVQRSLEGAPGGNR